MISLFLLDEVLTIETSLDTPGSPAAITDNMWTSKREDKRKGHHRPHRNAPYRRAAASAYEERVRMRGVSNNQSQAWEPVEQTAGMDAALVVSITVAILLYFNTLTADFAYDDSRAILKNPDLLPETPLYKLWQNDFWGTPLTHSGSHKSYRPLCVLTFRLNHLIGGLQPFGFHLVNVFLHAIVTGVFTYTAGQLFSANHGGDRKRMSTMVAGLVFASHPIHTEAVAGVVGRADMLSCLFFLLSFLAYMKYCKYRDKISGVGEKTPPQNGTRRAIVVRKWVLLGLTAACACASMLSKEQGVTVLGVCVVYDIFLNSGLRVKDIFTIFQKQWRGLLEGLTCLTLIGGSLVGFRLLFMGNKPPEFAPADNPASDSESLLTRSLTYLYLPALNFWLLLYPKVLSFDWSMGAVPLVESIWDPRNLCTLTLYAIIGHVTMYLIRTLNADAVRPWSVKQKVAAIGNGDSIGAPQPSSQSSSFSSNGNHVTSLSSSSSTLTSRRRTGRRSSSSSTDSNEERGSSSSPCLHRLTPPPDSASHILLIATSLIILPFIPATNLFFYVGFVIAERVLYMPSMGFCLLVAHGAYILQQKYCSNNLPRKRLLHVALGVLILSYGTRTIIRNQDWQSEENLYRSGIAVNPAKAWGNLANILNSQGKVAEAEEAYKAALNQRGNMADVHYNLGILYQDQGRYNEAVDSYQRAIQCRPRLTMAHLNLGIVFSNLNRKDEAENIYRHCAEIDISGLKDPRLHENTKISALYNLGRLLADQDRHHEATVVYEEAISRRPSHYPPQSLYNMLGESHFKLDHLAQAEKWYQAALSAKSDHAPAHLTMGKLMQRKGLLPEAEHWFQKAVSLEPKDSSVFQHYGQFLSETGRHQEATESYLKAVSFSQDPSDFELVFNTANALRQAGRNQEAETYYKIAAEKKPDLATAHMNLGAMLHFNGKLEAAESSYLAALKLQPSDQVTQANLQKLRNLMAKAKNKGAS